MDALPLISLRPRGGRPGSAHPRGRRKPGGRRWMDSYPYRCAEWPRGGRRALHTLGADVNQAEDNGCTYQLISLRSEWPRGGRPGSAHPRGRREPGGRRWMDSLLLIAAQNGHVGSSGLFTASGQTSTRRKTMDGLLPYRCAEWPRGGRPGSAHPRGRRKPGVKTMDALPLISLRRMATWGSSGLCTPSGPTINQAEDDGWTPTLFPLRRMATWRSSRLCTPSGPT